MSDPTAPEPAPLKCFVIMPFTETIHCTKTAPSVTIAADQWNHIFDQWIKKAVESFPDHKIMCKRSTATPGNFIKGIVQDLSDAHLVVADLTGNRPNVYYELGIRNALRTGTVMITQDLRALPSDLQTYYCFQYDYREKTHEYGKAFAAFESEMHEKLRALVSANFPSDNPVSDFLGARHYEQARVFEREKGKLLRLLGTLAETFERARDGYGEFINRLNNGEMPKVIVEDLRDLWQPRLIHELHTRMVLDIEWELFEEDVKAGVLFVTSHTARLAHLIDKMDTSIGFDNPSREDIAAYRESWITSRDVLAEIRIKADDAIAKIREESPPSN